MICVTYKNQYGDRKTTRIDTYFWVAFVRVRFVTGHRVWIFQLIDNDKQVSTRIHLSHRLGRIETVPVLQTCCSAGAED